MRKRAKKILFVLLLCFCMCGITMTASAATEYVDGYLRYTVEDGSVTITGYNGRESEVTVPSKIAGVPVNSIAEGAFSNATGVTKVNLPDTIMTIEEGAFTVGQTVVYNSNTDDTLVTEPESGETPSTEQPAESPTQNPTSTPAPTSAPEPTPAVTQPSTVTDKAQDFVTETQKNGGVEEVEIDFSDGLESTATADSAETSESEESRKEQDMPKSEEVDTSKESDVADEADAEKADNKGLLIVAGIMVLAAAIAGICVYRKKGRR